MSTEKDGASDTLEQIIRRLNPNVPAGARSDAMPRIPRDSGAVRQMTTYLRADPFGKVLLTGHIGVGKSTELLRLANELAFERFVVRCSVADSLGVQNVDTFTLLVVILEAAIRSWLADLGPMPSGLVEELVQKIRDRQDVSEALTRTELAARYYLGYLESGDELAAVCAEWIRSLAVQYVANADLSSTKLNYVARACETILKEMEHRAARPVLVVIDDVDKVTDPALQQSLFIDRAMAWLRLPCAVIATLPFDAYFRERSAEIDELWGQVLVLDPLPVPDTDLDQEPYWLMLREAGAHELFSAGQALFIAQASGGLPRTFVHFCSTCALYALQAKETQVLNSHISLVLQDMANKWRGRLTDADYEAMLKVLESEGANVRDAVQCLRDGILIRDGSQPPEKQYRIPFWAQPLLDAYRKRTRGPKPAASQSPR